MYGHQSTQYSLINHYHLNKNYKNNKWLKKQRENSHEYPMRFVTLQRYFETVKFILTATKTVLFTIILYNCFWINSLLLKSLSKY